MKLQEVCDQLQIKDRCHWKPQTTISRITSDSRLITPGSIFVACRGSRMNGHDFIRQAVQAKAAAIVFEEPPEESLPKKVVGIQVQDAQACLADMLNRFHGFPDRSVKLVGVTGTNGKTTITYLLHRLLREHSEAASLGTLGYDWSGAHVDAVNTTPGAEILIPLLDQMRQENVKHCIMEVSSHALAQRRVHGLEFELGIFTQLTQDHLDYHGTMEDYFEAKRLFFSERPAPKKMLMNRDCPYGRRFLKENNQAQSFSIEKNADYYASELDLSFQGSRFCFNYPQGQIPFKIRLPLAYNVANCVSVLGALDMLGIDIRQIPGALAEIPGIPGRLERILGANDFQVFVDYAHTPDAVENVLSEAAALKPNRILTLFGCGGDRDRGKRALMAEAASRWSDIVCLTSDNPRSEDPEAILEDVRKGFSANAQASTVVFEVIEREVAIHQILSLAEPGDVVMILGKGHEHYQILGERKLPFDDRKVVRAFLKRKSRVFLS